MKQKFYLTLFLMMLMLLMVLSACQATSTPISTSDSDTPVSSDNPVNKLPVKDFTGYQQNVYVDKIDVFILESYPLQVAVTVIGNLPDGCTQIVGSKSSKGEGKTFEVFIYTERHEELACTTALVPFEETIRLNVVGLPAGKYLVKGYGSESSFTFDLDN